VLQAVVSQQLIPKKEGKGRVAAFEIMIATPAIRNLIREGKTHQIASSIQTGISMGMQSMDGSIANLYREGKISREEAISFAVDPESLMKMIA
jgi:twitching motility protein PilT